jgi:2,3-bisphosphoglycerate-dependent phosphoglycerate mutase
MGVLLLIRHGRTQANVDGVLAGRTPGVLLDEHGVETITQLGQRLAQVDIAHLVVSPLERTIQTAELAFAGRLTMTREERLLECDYGSWQGRSISDLAQEPLWEKVQNNPEQMQFPGGESMSQMSQRAVQATRDWDARLTSEHGENVIWAAVSHGDIIKAICADALGMELNQFQKIVIEPASISVIQYSESGSSVAKLNDTGPDWLASLHKVAPQLGGQSGKGNN